MEVIAQRDKLIGKVLFISGIILTVLSVLMLFVSAWSVIALIIVGLLDIVAIYLFVLLPKTAVMFDGNNFIFRFAFHSKVINPSSIEYLSYNEIGELHTRHSLWISLHILQNDVRNITVTIKNEEILSHFLVWPILNASAVKTEMEAIKEKINNI